MRGSADYFAKNLIFHGLSAHSINILTAAIIIDMIKTMWISESCLTHV